MFASKFAPIAISKAVKRFMGTGNELKTALFPLHEQAGGKMVPFAGYILPVQFEGAGVLKEHEHTRTKAGLFDVSHMGQIHWYGKDAATFLEKLVVSDIKGLRAGEATLSLIMQEDGGIVDDTIITNAGDYIYMVVNGACKWKDMDHFKKYLAENKNLDVKMEYQADAELVALQGPEAKNVMSNLLPKVNFTNMNFMSSTLVNVPGIPTPCRVTRCGYTGEDGFEISCHKDHVTAFVQMLLDNPAVKPAGLGCRDSLRLEAGLCLYGNDIDEKTNPVEASLLWTMGGPKGRRRVEQGFLGASHFLEKTGRPKPMARKRVGIAGMSAPARGHTEMYSADGSQKIGEITSGGFGPSYGKAMSMGYVSTANSADGSKVSLKIRGKMLPAEVTKMPFVATNYYRAPESKYF